MGSRRADRRQAQRPTRRQIQPLDVTGRASVVGAEMHVDVALSRGEDPAVRGGAEANNLDLVIAKREADLGLLVALR